MFMCTRLLPSEGWGDMNTSFRFLGVAVGGVAQQLAQQGAAHADIPGHQSPRWRVYSFI